MTTPHLVQRPRPSSTFRPVLAVLLIIVVALATGAALLPVRANAQESGSITIRFAACPHQISEPQALFNLCFDHPQAGVTVHYGWGDRGNQYTAVTDSNGYVSFTIDPGDISEDPDPNDDWVQGGIYVYEEMPAGYTSYDVYCTSDGEAVPLELTAFEPNAPKGIIAAVEAGADVRCDWYNIPPAGTVDPDPPAADPDPSETPVTRLPNTGSGSLLSNGADSQTFLALFVGLFIIIAAALGNLRRAA